MIDTLSENQWREYKSQGYSRLGKVLTDEELATLQERIDEIMMGRAPLDYDRMLMQLDQPETGKLGPQTKGHKGATLGYRKIQDLEIDPHFLAYMQKPLFSQICARVYGEDMDIACFRAMFMNKPAKEGTHLQWHQDRWSYLDRDPLVTIWTAICQGSSYRIFCKTLKSPPWNWRLANASCSIIICPIPLASIRPRHPGEPSVPVTWKLPPGQQRMRLTPSYSAKAP